MRQDATVLAVPEAVPAAVTRAVARAKQTIDPRIDKTAADMIVPFDRFDALLGLLRRRVPPPRPRCGGLGTHLRTATSTRT